MTGLLVILSEPERSAMAFDRLAGEYPGLSVIVCATVQEALPHCADTEILITIGAVLGRDATTLYRAMPRLCWIQSIGTGVDNLAGHPDLPSDVVVTNVRGLHGAQMSEAAIAAMLTLARDVPRIVRNQGNGAWERFPARLLSGASVGILGMGAIAEALAPRLKSLGMQVIGISATPRDTPGFDRVVARDRLMTVVPALDWLVLLTPHSPATHHIIDGAVLAAMKRDACLVNLARGGVVDEVALLDALQNGVIAGAALDVFATEPLPPDHPFWSQPNLILTPHIAGFHTGYAADVYQAIAANVARYRIGGPNALLNKV